MSSLCVMISAPIRRVDTPHDVAHTYSSSLFLLMNFTSNAFAKFCPRKCDVPDCNALPSCIIASMVKVSSAPAKRSLADFTPFITGTAIYFSAKSAYTLSIFFASSRASSLVACAVCPSCHKNSAVRRNRRVRISQRSTFAHWLQRIGRSRYDLIQLRYVFQMIVSDVGRMISSSSSRAAGSTTTPCPSGSVFKR